MFLFLFLVRYWIEEIEDVKAAFYFREGIHGL